MNINKFKMVVNGQLIHMQLIVPVHSLADIEKDKVSSN